jgi:hypothetical protein
VPFFKAKALRALLIGLNNNKEWGDPSLFSFFFSKQRVG